MSEQTTTPQANPEMDLLTQAFLAPTQDLVIKAEDIEMGNDMDWSKSFFDPKVDKTYTLKFVKNLEGLDPIVHRKIYKKIPDPKRKGKTFHVVSSGVAKTCKTLDLFFELNNLKKEGDALAVQKLDKFMGVTNQAACIVEILASPDKEEIGTFRIFAFSSYGPNATVANLINAKVNPSEEKIKNGFEKEDIFNIFESSVMILECKEATYDGVKGRDFTTSEWAPKKRGAFIRIEDKEHVFTKADMDENGKIKPEVLPFFMELIARLKNPDISLHNLFCYKTIDDPKNTESTIKYLEEMQSKVDLIIPIIRDAKSISDIIGATSTESGDSAKSIGGNVPDDILKNSVPNELVGSILNTGSAEIPVPSPAKNKDITDILNS